MESAINYAKEYSNNIYLDHYDWFLSSFYEELWFEEISRLAFDSKYDKNWEFEKTFWEQDIIFRKFAN